MKENQNFVVYSCFLQLFYSLSQGDWVKTISVLWVKWTIWSSIPFCLVQSRMSHRYDGRTATTPTTVVTERESRIENILKKGIENIKIIQSKVEWRCRLWANFLTYIYNLHKTNILIHDNWLCYSFIEF